MWCERVVSVCVWRCYRQGVISRAPHLRKDQTKTLRETRENIRERGKGENGVVSERERVSFIDHIVEYCSIKGETTKRVTENEVFVCVCCVCVFVCVCVCVCVCLCACVRARE